MDVRTGRFFADRDKTVRAQFRLELGHGIAGRNAHANPVRLAQHRRTRVEAGAIARNLVFAEQFLAGADRRGVRDDRVVHQGNRNGLIEGIHACTLTSTEGAAPAPEVTGGGAI